MIEKHKGCRECNLRMISVGRAKDDIRTALRKHAALPTQRNREACEVAQGKVREAVRLFKAHMGEGVKA